MNDNFVYYVAVRQPDSSDTELNTYTLALGSTVNQTITLKYTEPGAQAVTKTSSNVAQYFTVNAGTPWTASVAPASGYRAGTLSPGSSGIVNSDTIVVVSAATNI